MNEYQYQKNIINIEKFFKTDKYKFLKEKGDIKCIKSIINKEFLDDGTKIYKDPDSFDKLLYQTIKNKYYENKYDLGEIVQQYNSYYYMQNINSVKIKLSLDCVIGWKALFDLYNFSNDIKLEEFLKMYRIIRNPNNRGHLVWPAHRKSINTERFKQFSDRVDYTLFDIKNYYNRDFDMKNLRLLDAYNNPSTCNWLNQFDNFEDFINKLKFEHWCIKKYNNKYEVLDLSKNCMEYITDYLVKKNDYKITLVYLENLIDVIQK